MTVETGKYGKQATEKRGGTGPHTGIEGRTILTYLHMFAFRPRELRWDGRLGSRTLEQRLSLTTARYAQTPPWFFGCRHVRRKQQEKAASGRPTGHGQERRTVREEHDQGKIG